MSSPSFFGDAESVYSVDASVDDLLDQWEQRRKSGRPLSVDQFIERKCAGVSPDIIKEFKAKAEALQSMDAGLDMLNKNDTGTGSTTGADSKARQSRESDFKPGAEPIPGYRLVSWLGDGGFGEVWKATGPGDFQVALKFIRLRSHVGNTELEAVRLVKDIRHPHLLSMFGTWQTDRHLIIAMELADQTLLDRLREVKAQGLLGIPSAELLKHLGDAAEALDFLNEPRHSIGEGKQVSVAHRDTKPQNLLLVGGRVKVADFGLAKILEKSLVTQTKSMTAAYAAPERFEGKTSKQTDQYALAITYCELLTGRWPFTGDLLALMGAHLHKAPDLSMLPPAERLVVARALAKIPDQRWPSCTAFVTALQSATAAPAPKVEINETKVLLTGTPGQQLQYELTLTGPVSVNAQSNQKWLSIGQATQVGTLTVIPLLVRPVPAEPGRTLYAKVHLKTNSDQQFEVQVGLRMDVQRLLPIDRNAVCLGEDGFEDRVRVMNLLVPMFPADHLDAVRRTQEIANRVDLELDMGREGALGRRERCSVGSTVSVRVDVRFMVDGFLSAGGQVDEVNEYHSCALHVIVAQFQGYKYCANSAPPNR